MISEERNTETTSYQENSGNERSNTAKMFFRKRRGCPLCSTSSPKIDYKNPNLLRKFISEGGRMLPSRITNVCSKHQRQLKKAIRFSRILALLPFVFLGK